ncbi:MAG: hypothetical protein PHT54_02640 [Candidatus Nanoarchaeia archaeon]|nr:hypothetical protein [Candidatus Nanoarchaeia archaeon]
MRKITALVFILILALALPVSAKLTAYARGQAVLSVDVEEGSTKIIDRTIWVKNVNDIPVKVAIEAAEDLKGRVDVKDAEFILQPNEEKNARYLIQISQPGVYYGKMNVGFSPAESTIKEQGVGVSLAITVSADGPGEKFVSPGPNETTDEEDTEVPADDTTDDTTTDDTTTDEEGPGVSVSPGGNNPVEPEKNVNVAMIIFLGLLALVIIAGLIAFLRGGKK